MEIKLIKTEKDYGQALTEVEQLWGSDEGTEAGDKLELLVTLIEAYEAKHYPIYPPDPVAAIEFRMDQLSLRKKDLVPYLGQISRVTEVLNHKRSLSLAMIRKLHKHLHIPLESLIDV